MTSLHYIIILMALMTSGSIFMAIRYLAIAARILKASRVIGELLAISLSCEGCAANIRGMMQAGIPPHVILAALKAAHPMDGNPTQKKPSPGYHNSPKN